MFFKVVASLFISITIKDSSVSILTRIANVSLLLFWVLFCFVLTTLICVYHFDFNFHSPFSLHVLICYPYIFFGEMSIQTFAHFWIGCFFFLFLSFDCFYITCDYFWIVITPDMKSSSQNVINKLLHTGYVASSEG